MGFSRDFRAREACVKIPAWEKTIIKPLPSQLISVVGESVRTRWRNPEHSQRLFGSYEACVELTKVFDYCHRLAPFSFHILAQRSFPVLLVLERRVCVFRTGILTPIPVCLDSGPGTCKNFALKIGGEKTQKIYKSRKSISRSSNRALTTGKAFTAFLSKMLCLEWIIPHV